MFPRTPLRSVKRESVRVSTKNCFHFAFFYLAKVALSSDTTPTPFPSASVQQYFLQSQICTQLISFRNSRTCRRLLVGAIHRHTGQRSAPDPSVETFEQWPIRMNQFSTAISTERQQQNIPNRNRQRKQEEKMKKLN